MREETELCASRIGELAPKSLSVSTWVRVEPFGAAAVAVSVDVPAAAPAGPGRLGLFVGVWLCGASAPGTI